MANRLVDQAEAARILGKTVEELNSLRDRGKLFPKRDGGEWKYDTDELDRFKRDQDDSGSSWETDLNDIELVDDNEPDSILLSEAELGESAETTKSTIIGKSKSAAQSAESDIRLAGDSDLRLEGSGTSPGGGKPSSDIELLSGSGLSLTDDSKISMETGSGFGSNIFADDLKLEELGSSSQLGSGELKLSPDDEISLGDSPSDRAKSTAEHDTAKGGMAGDSGLLLSDDDELVLGGSGSDLTLNAADSGIMLVDPADSGLSLEQPLTLGSSGKNQENLVIGEDDIITLEEDVDVEGATQLRTDEDFALTPGGMDDDDSDSGSQVIALDSEEDLSASGAMFSSGDNLLSESPLGGMPDALGAGAMPGAAVAMMPVSTIPEAPYSIWNILSLLACIVFLALGGMMVYDLSQSIWSWHGATTYNSAIMDSLLGMFEGK